MNANFARSLQLVLQSEGGFVNDPRDPGGATNMGVTIGMARSIGLDIDHDGDVDVIDIKLLKPDDAAKVYKHFYWDAICGDQLPGGVDYASFDYAVNSGTGRAAKELQQVVGAPVTGRVDAGTVAAALRKPAASIITHLCDDRLVFMRSLKIWPTFGKGWSARVASVQAEALRMAG